MALTPVGCGSEWMGQSPRSVRLTALRTTRATLLRSSRARLVSRWRSRATATLEPGAFVLDAGCGSGRDAKWFAQQGGKVAAFNVSPELARLASQYCGFEVAIQRFSDVTETSAYDGIWCCASLLHVA